ncbi:hypothetical protein ACTVZO_43695 [Streptomyces sp. IBSNAI002]
MNAPEDLMSNYTFMVDAEELLVDDYATEQAVQPTFHCPTYGC